MASRAARIAAVVGYGLLVFLGAVLLGFVVLPTLAHAAGFFPIDTEARAAFSLVTLQAVPVLAGLSVAATLAYDRLATLPIPWRVAAWLATCLLVWLAGAAVAVAVLG
jgi:hypothetical protein